jgi:hypothetical protein
MSTSLILSIIALLVSVISAVIASIAAVAARRTAVAEEGTLAIERERRLEERKPHLTAVLEGTGPQRILKISLDSEEPLASLDVVIAEWHFYRQPDPPGGWGFEFNPRVYGVVVPEPGNAALSAFSYDLYGQRAGLKPHGTISWAVNTKKRLDWVRLDVTFYGDQGERWEQRLTVEAQPEIEDTVA